MITIPTALALIALLLYLRAKGSITIPAALLSTTLGVTIAGSSLGQTLQGVAASIVQVLVAAGRAVVG